MIRHVVLFRWKPGFDPAEWFAVVRDLPRHIPEIKALSAGADVLVAQGLIQLRRAGESRARLREVADTALATWAAPRS